MSERAVSYLTYHDAISHLLDAYQTGRGQVPLRNARRAVLNAYRDVPTLHQWRYYERRGQVVTSASYDTGTVAYDHTGGANERQVTLTGGTWPAWVAEGSVIISENRYKVDERKSDTVITLTQDTNPGADIASGTGFNAYRSLYVMPIGFKKTHGLVEVASGYWPDQVTPGDLLDYEVGNYQPSRPVMYTFRSSKDFPGRMCVEFGPPPSESRTYDFVYERAPRSLRVLKATAGTVSTSGTTVTGTGTNFTSSMVGSVIRFGTTSLLPTGQAGDYIDGDLEDAEYVEQGIVASVTNSTSLELEEATTDTFSSVKYLISDPVDIDAMVMESLFLRKCEAEYLRLQGRQNSGNQNDLIEADRAVMLAQRQAQILNSRDRSRMFTGKSRIADLGDWAIIDE